MQGGPGLVVIMIQLWNYAWPPEPSSEALLSSFFFLKQ